MTYVWDPCVFRGGSRITQTGGASATHASYLSLQLCARPPQKWLASVGAAMAVKQSGDELEGESSVDFGAEKVHAGSLQELSVKLDSETRIKLRTPST